LVMVGLDVLCTVQVISVTLNNTPSACLRERQRQRRMTSARRKFCVQSADKS